jgi:hypothetical protein
MAFCCNLHDVDICNALQDILDVTNEMGTSIVYVRRTEQDVTRDSLGTIKSRSLETRYSMKANPVERYPDYKRLERAGLREGCECMIYTPIAAWVEVGLINLLTIGRDFAALETIRSTVILDGSEWRIADKGLNSRIAGVPLYITLGLKRS